MKIVETNCYLQYLIGRILTQVLLTSYTQTMTRCNSSRVSNSTAIGTEPSEFSKFFWNNSNP